MSSREASASRIGELRVRVRVANVCGGVRKRGRVRLEIWLVLDLQVDSRKIRRIVYCFLVDLI